MKPSYITEIWHGASSRTSEPGRTVEHGIDKERLSRQMKTSGWTGSSRQKQHPRLHSVELWRLKIW